MSIAHLWQQVPSPAPSPTVERIVVEMAERSSGVGGWTAALIAGCAAILAAGLTAVLTHAFTTSRDSGSWLRQRVFEIVEELDENRKTMLDEYTNFAEAVTYHLTRESLLKMKEMHNWDAFDNAYNKYAHALSRLNSLVHSGSKARLPISLVRITSGSFERSVRHPILHNVAGSPSFAYAKEVDDSRESFKNSHTKLMGSIYPNFFASPYRRWKYKRDNPEA